MIYEQVPSEAPLQQGDIFRHIPNPEFSLASLSILADEKQVQQIQWQELGKSSDLPSPITAVVSIFSVTAIVITQNCDAARGKHICLCEIDDFLSATNKNVPPKTPKKWQSLVTQHSRTNQRFFYLPADPDFQFEQRMAVDFRSMLRVLRDDLETMRPDFRVGRLNPIATEHFRESLAQFYRRYPYDEWYPLTAEEFQEYAKACPEPVEPFPWQKPVNEQNRARKS